MLTQSPPSYSRDLPIVQAIRRLPLKIGRPAADAEPTKIHIHVINAHRAKLWALSSFAMIFIDDDVLYRPQRAQAPRECLAAQKAGEDEDTQKADVKESMVCGLRITYSAEVPPASSVGGIHTDTDAQTLMEKVQECAEECARDGVRLHRQVQRRVWDMLYMPRNQLGRSTLRATVLTRGRGKS